MLYNVQAKEEVKQRVELEKDTIFKNVRGKTPTEIDEWVESNTNTPESIKSLLKLLKKAMVVLFNEKT